MTRSYLLALAAIAVIACFVQPSPAQETKPAPATRQSPAQPAQLQVRLVLPEQAVLAADKNEALLEVKNVDTRQATLAVSNPAEGGLPTADEWVLGLFFDVQDKDGNASEFVRQENEGDFWRRVSTSAKTVVIKPGETASFKIHIRNLGSAKGETLMAMSGKFQIRPAIGIHNTPEAIWNGLTVGQFVTATIQGSPVATKPAPAAPQPTAEAPKPAPPEPVGPAARPTPPSLPQADIPRDIFGGLITEPNDMDKWHRGKVKTIGDNELTVEGQNFKPSALVGKVICPNYERPIKDGIYYSYRYYHIVSNTADTIKTNPEDGKLTEFAQAGDTYLLAGFFRIETVKDRYVLIDPLGHPFIPMGVAVLTDNIVGYMTPQMMKDKYGTRDKWAVASINRLKGLGWTATMEYGWATWVQTDKVAKKPAGYFHPQVPYIRIVRGAEIPGMRDKQRGGMFDSPIKNILDGNHGRSMMDVFDPQFAAVYGKGKTPDWGPEKYEENDPWVIGHVTEEGDNLFGMMRSQFHMGYFVAIARPFQDKTINQYVKPAIGYKDAKVYTKQAMADFLKAKYGTIEKLNTAWGSTYASFGSEGDLWGKGGTRPAKFGLLDEDGDYGKAWLGTARKGYGEDGWNGYKPEVYADLMKFQEKVHEQFFKGEYQGLKDHCPHLVMGYVFDEKVRPEDYFASSPWFDMTFQPAPDSVLNLKDIGKNVIKPWCVTAYICSEEDSPLAGLYKDPKAWRWPGTFYKTQELRGQEYYNRFLNAYERSAASNGMKTCVGMIWWNWCDDNSERREWGIATWRDNLYDGKEATKLGADGKAGTWDDEPADYGDCCSWIRLANDMVTRILWAQLKGLPKPGLGISGKGPSEIQTVPDPN